MASRCGTCSSSTPRTKRLFSSTCCRRVHTTRFLTVPWRPPRNWSQSSKHLPRPTGERVGVRGVESGFPNDLPLPTGKTVGVSLSRPPSPHREDGRGESLYDLPLPTGERVGVRGVESGFPT